MCVIDWALVGGVATAIATFLLAIITFRLWKATDKQREATEAQASAAKAQSEAANAQLTLATLQHQAVVAQNSALARMQAFYARRTVLEAIMDLNAGGLGPEPASRMMVGLTKAIEQLEVARNAATAAGDQDKAAAIEGALHELMKGADKVGLLTKPYIGAPDRATSQEKALRFFESTKSRLDGVIDVVALKGA